MLNVTSLVKMYPGPFGGMARRLCQLLGADIPRSVEIGRNVRFPHNAMGTVIHENTIIGDDVKIYQNVTLGRGDIWRDGNEAQPCGFVVGRGVVLCAGAKIIANNEVITIGEGSVIGANAVLTKSTGKNEVWAGVPAKRIKVIDRSDLR